MNAYLFAWFVFAAAAPSEVSSPATTQAIFWEKEIDAMSRLIVEEETFTDAKHLVHLLYKFKLLVRQDGDSEIQERELWTRRAILSLSGVNPVIEILAAEVVSSPDGDLNLIAVFNQHGWSWAYVIAHSPNGHVTVQPSAPRDRVLEISSLSIGPRAEGGTVEMVGDRVIVRLVNQTGQTKAFKLVEEDGASEWKQIKMSDRKHE